MKTKKGRDTRHKKEPHDVGAAKTAHHRGTRSAAEAKAAPSEAAAASAVSNGTPEAPAPATDRLRRLAKEIREAYAETRADVERCESAMAAAVEHALRVGGLLNEARKLVPHGQWERWLADNVPGISLSTVRRWTKLASNPSALTDSGGIRSKTEAYRKLELWTDGDGTTGGAGSDDDGGGERGEAIDRDGADGAEPERHPPGRSRPADLEKQLSTLPSFRRQLAEVRTQSLTQAQAYDLRATQHELDMVLGRTGADGGSDEAAGTADDRADAGDPLEGLVRDAIRLRQKAERASLAGGRLTPEQCSELRATEVMLRDVRERLGGPEAKPLTAESRGGTD